MSMGQVLCKRDFEKSIKMISFGNKTMIPLVMQIDDSCGNEIVVVRRGIGRVTWVEQDP